MKIEWVFTISRQFWESVRSRSSSDLGAFRIKSDALNVLKSWKIESQNVFETVNLFLGNHKYIKSYSRSILCPRNSFMMMKLMFWSEIIYSAKISSLCAHKSHFRSEHSSFKPSSYIFWSKTMEMKNADVQMCTLSFFTTCKQLYHNVQTPKNGGLAMCKLHIVKMSTLFCVTGISL